MKKVLVIVLAMLLATSVGFNLWQAKKLEEDKDTMFDIAWAQYKHGFEDGTEKVMAAFDIQMGVVYEWDK